MQRFLEKAKHFKANIISVKIMLLYYFDITVIVRLQLDTIIIITISLFCTISYLYWHNWGDRTYIKMYFAH